MTRNRWSVAALAAVVVLAAACDPDIQSAEEARQSTSTTLATTTTAAPTTTAEALPADGGMPNLNEIERVVDGDTVRLQGGEKVRLIGVEAPEWTNTKECWGAEATAALVAMLPVGTPVFLTANAGLDGRARGNDRDQYGRLLRYVDMGGPSGPVDVGEALVREGLAESSGGKYPEQDRRARYDKAQADAEAADVGMWSDVKPASCPAEK